MTVLLSMPFFNIKNIYYGMRETIMVKVVRKETKSSNDEERKEKTTNRSLKKKKEGKII